MAKQENSGEKCIVRRIDTEDPLRVVQKDPKHPSGEPSKQELTIQRGLNTHQYSASHRPIQGARNSK